MNFFGQALDQLLFPAAVSRLKSTISGNKIIQLQNPEKNHNSSFSKNRSIYHFTQFLLSCMLQSGSLGKDSIGMYFPYNLFFAPEGPILAGSRFCVRWPQFSSVEELHKGLENLAVCIPACTAILDSSWGESCMDDYVGHPKAQTQLWLSTSKTEKGICAQLPSMRVVKGKRTAFSATKFQTEGRRTVVAKDCHFNIVRCCCLSVEVVVGTAENILFSLKV